MNRRRVSPDQDGPTPVWMVTYSDLMSLLLAFFVLLFAFSEIDKLKFQRALASMRGALGLLPGGAAIAAEVLPDPAVTGAEAQRWVFVPDMDQIRRVEQRVREALARAGAEGAVLVQIEERGLLLRFRDSVLFDSGRADLRPAGIRVLDQLVPVLKAIPNPILVEGHTDSRPIHTPRYPSNWELSTGRAGAVIRYLIESGGIDPARFTAAGYAEHRPIADNDSAAGRQQNRRVDFVIRFLGEASYVSEGEGAVR